MRPNPDPNPSPNPSPNPKSSPNPSPSPKRNPDPNPSPIPKPKSLTTLNRALTIHDPEQVEHEAAVHLATPCPTPAPHYS